MKTPDEIKKGIECCNSTHYDACPDCPYKGECDAVFSCIRRKSEDTTAYIQQLEASYSQVSKALCGKENATLDEVLQAISQVKSSNYNIPARSGKTLALKQAQRIAELEQELAAVKRERDAAVNDLEEITGRVSSFHLDCDYCKDKDKPVCKNCGWQWRGICPENTEVPPDA